MFICFHTRKYFISNLSITRSPVNNHRDCAAPGRSEPQGQRVARRSDRRVTTNDDNYNGSLAVAVEKKKKQNDFQTSERLRNRERLRDGRACTR